MTGDLVGLAISLALLALTGDQFILAISRIAGALRVRPTIVGALVGGLGTSLASPPLLLCAVRPSSPSAAWSALSSPTFA